MKLTCHPTSVLISFLVIMQKPFQFSSFSTVCFSLRALQGFHWRCSVWLCLQMSVVHELGCVVGTRIPCYMVLLFILEVSLLVFLGTTGYFLYWYLESISSLVCWTFNHSLLLLVIFFTAMLLKSFYYCSHVYRLQAQLLAWLCLSRIFVFP